MVNVILVLELEFLLPENQARSYDQKNLKYMIKQFNMNQYECCIC